MTQRLLILATGLLLAFAALSGGCNNGGGALTLEEYFQQLDELDNDQKEKSDALDAQLEDAQEVSPARDLLQDELAVFDEFLDGAKDLDPPDEVLDAHNDAIAGLETFRDVFADLLEEFGAATTLDEAFALFIGVDTTGIDQANAACVQLEQIAADNGITVDLDCDDEGDGTPSTLEAYFQQLDAAENAYRVRSATVDAQLNALDDTTVGDAGAIWGEAIDAIDAFVAELEGIEPPAEVAEAHAESVAGFQMASTLIEQALPDVESATTLDEVNAIFTTEEFTSTDASLDGACAALLGIAEANGIVVDLGCDSANSQ